MGWIVEDDEIYVVKFIKTKIITDMTNMLDLNIIIIHWMNDWYDSKICFIHNSQIWKITTMKNESNVLIVIQKLLI